MTRQTGGLRPPRFRDAAPGSLFRQETSISYHAVVEGTMEHDWTIEYDGDSYTVLRDGDPWHKFRTLARAQRKYPFARLVMSPAMVSA